MQPRQILYLAVLSIVTVFSVVAGWECVVEDMVEGYWAIGGDGKTLYERWELVITATCATVLFWAVSSPALLRILAERDRAERRLREAFEELDRKVEDRTADLENEIAERARAERGLRRLASIVATSADAITAMTQGGIITDWNSAAVDMYGFTADEAIGRHISIITPPDRTEEVRMFIEQTRRGNVLRQIETARRRKDGRRLEISLSVARLEDQAGNVVGLTAIHRDITDQKRAAEAIRESQDRISGVLELAQEAVISIDDSRRIRLFNEGAETIFGYAAEEVLGHPLEILIPERFRGAHPEKIAAFAETSGASRPLNERDGIVGVRKDGTEFSAEASISKLERNGKTSFTVMLRDITERKLIELAREQAYEHLIEAQIVIEEQAEDLMKLAEESDQARCDAESASRAKSDFLASMSHEIRTPMNGVIGMAGILLDSELSEEQREQTHTIKESADALLMLLNDILDLSKIEAGQVELELLNFDLRGLLDSVAALWDSHLHDKGLTFSIEPAPEIARVLKSDPTRIRQMLFNLIGNAVKFTEHGGVTLAVSQRDLADDELELRFAVTDTGIGIAPEARSRLFTKFSQADGSVTRKYGGTGLGLAICKELAGLLGGEVGVESTPGQGSTFWFTVRCAPGDVEAVAAEAGTEAAETPTSVRPLRILAAEDNHTNQVVLLSILAKSGHAIDMVANGVEAVGAVMRVPYDLVLMDANMPEMDGVTATRKIRDLPGEVGRIPIIALTTNAMKGDRETYMEAGMTDYVSKPINPEKLFAAIARCSGHEPTDVPHGTEVASLAAHDVAGAGDDAGGLEDLIDDLDTLIEKA